MGLPALSSFTTCSTCSSPSFLVGSPAAIVGPEVGPATAAGRLTSSTAADDLVLDPIRILEEHRVVVQTMLRKQARPIDDVRADPRELRSEAIDLGLGLYFECQMMQSTRLAAMDRLLRETLARRIDAKRQLGMDIFDDVELVRLDDRIRAVLEIESE